MAPYTLPQCTTLKPEQNGRHFADDISKCIFFEKTFVFGLRFHWSLFLRVQLTLRQQWFGKWLGAEQATSHYMNLWWPSVLTHIYALLGVDELLQFYAEYLVMHAWQNVKCQFEVQVNFVNWDIKCWWDARHIWTIAGLLLIGPLRTNFSEIRIKIQPNLKIPSAKCRPFYLGLNVFRKYWKGHHVRYYRHVGLG